VVAKRLSVRETEKLVVRMGKDFTLTSAKKPRGKGAHGGDLARLEEELSDGLATRVAIKTGARGRGQIVIDFSGLDQLDGLIEKLRR